MHVVLVKHLNYKVSDNFIDQIAESKKTSADHILSRICSTGGPSLANVTVRFFI